MRSTILKKILNLTEFVPVQEETRKYKYELAIQELEKQKIEVMHLNEVLEIIRKSEFLELFIKEMDEMKEELLFTSGCHGVMHCERVALFAFAIGVLENLDEQEFKILLEAVKYHDIGRINDKEDECHGRRSAEKIEKHQLVNEFSIEDGNIIKAICIGHSVGDELFEEIMNEFSIENKIRCKKIFEILKDADALDRARLKYSLEDIAELEKDDSIIDMSYLRTKYSKNMVPGAYELYENYEYVLRRILEDTNK